jgi:hypothetical protein
MRETTLNMGQGETNFMKERLNVNIGVRKVRCPHNFCQDCRHIAACRSASSTQLSLVLSLSIYINPQLIGLILRHDGQINKFQTILNLYEHVKQPQLRLIKNWQSGNIKNHKDHCSTENNIISCTQYYWNICCIY